MNKDFDFTKKASSLKHAFDEAFDDDDCDIDQTLPEEKQEKASSHRTLDVVVGLIVIILAAIGLVSTLKFTFGIINNVADRTYLKNEFAEYIYPVVVVDAPAFDSVDKLPNSTVITASVWDIILGGDTSKYTQDGTNIVVPYIDVEASAKKLFGNDISLTHETVGDYELSFPYDEQTKCYKVPSSPKYLPYSPYVEEFEESGSVYTLKVGYMAPGHYWLSPDEDNMPAPEKYMKYTIQKDGNSMKILSVQTYSSEGN